MLRWCCRWRHVSVALTFLTISCGVSRAADAEQRFASQVDAVANDLQRPRLDSERVESGDQHSRPSSARGLEEIHRHNKTALHEGRHASPEEVGDRFGRSVEEDFTESDVVCGINLLGFVVFIMTLYYLVHWPDEDMRIYVWTVISTTISIFLAIFAFSSVQLVVERCLSEGDNAWKLAALGFTQLLAWFCIMQVSIAYVSGVMDDQPFKPPDQETSLEAQKLRRKISFKSIATLLAHCTGFAAINFGGCLQHMYPFNTSAAARFLVVPLMYLFNFIAGRLVRIVRVRIRRRVLEAQERHNEANAYTSLAVLTDTETELASPSSSRAGTARGTPQEKPRDRKEEFEWCLKNWDEETYEAELDVAGLSISFLLVQSIRAAVTGVMPNNLGIEPGAGIHPQSCSMYMVGFGFGFALLCVLHVVVHAWFFPEGKEVRPLTCESAVMRLMRILQVSFAMAFAWSLFVASKWEIARYLPQYRSNGVVSRVILTVELSFIAFWVIMILDKLADADWTGETTDRAIITIIGALSTLVGFAYEQSFDGAVEALASVCFKSHPMIGELVLTFGVWVIVYPAWSKYILKKLLLLKEEKEESNSGKMGNKALEMASLT